MYDYKSYKERQSFDYSLNDCVWESNNRMLGYDQFGVLREWEFNHYGDLQPIEYGYEDYEPMCGFDAVAWDMADKYAGIGENER